MFAHQRLPNSLTHPLTLSVAGRAETVYDGLELFQEGRRLQNLIDVPGVQQGERAESFIFL